MTGSSAGPRPRFTSRVAVLAVVLCAIALSLAYPVREYIAERRQIDQLQGQNAQIAGQVQHLKAEQRALSSPTYVEQQARDKLHMCFPDQTCYVVIEPTPKATTASHSTQSSATPWYGRLWGSVRQADRPPAR
ncbi:MAG TPA: septum formation initiator family protein [Streptosporangiaceae bacterium]